MPLTKADKSMLDNVTSPAEVDTIVDAIIAEGVEIADGSVTSDKIAADAVTADKIKVTGDGAVSLSSIDATAANNLAGALTNITALQSTVSGTNAGLLNTFYQSTQPSSTNTGDLWFNTADDQLKRYNGTSWEAIRDSGIQQAIDDAADAADLADNRITTYYSSTEPTVDSLDGNALGAEDVGDLWFDTANNNKLYRWSETSTNVYAWVSVQDTTNFVAGTTLIDGGNISTNTIDTTSIADGAITTTKIDGGAITTDKITANAVTTAKINANAITADKIASNAITSEKIAADSITADRIKVGGNDGLSLSSIDPTAATDLANALTNIESLESTVAGTDDGLLHTFYQSTQPSSTNVGDLWFNTTDNQLKRYNGTSWELIRDNGIQQAIDDAADAANIADGRISTYYSNTAPTVDAIDGNALGEEDVGDLWFDTANNNKLYRWSETSTDVYGWVSVQDTTNFVAGTTLIDGGRISTGTITASQIAADSITADRIKVGGSDGISLSAIDATAANDLAGALTNITALQNTVSGTEDGLLNTFYQATQPSSPNVGDLWFNDSSGELKRYDGTSWELIRDSRIQQAIDDAADAANIADNRITTYYSDSPPTLDSIDGNPLDADDVGDLWFDTDENNKLYRFSEISPNSYAWVSVQDKTNFYPGTTLIDGGNIYTETITATSIVDGAITTTKIDGGAITTDKIDANAITSDKISAGAIASGSMFTAGVINGEAISSNTTISSTFQSTNFDGTYDASTGNFGVGTQGFYLHGDTGTAVFNTMICRDNIISGDFIKFDDQAGFAVDNDGNFKVAVDDDTLTINNGRLEISTVPSTAVVNATADLNFAGGYNSFSLGSLSGTTRINKDKVVFIMDTHDYVESAQNIERVDLRNLSFDIDYSGLNDITNVEGLSVLFQMFTSDSPNELLNSNDAGSTVRVLNNPVLPLTPITYNANLSVTPRTLDRIINETNRYLIFVISVNISPEVSTNDIGSISLSVNGNTETQLVFEATGEISSENNNLTDLDGFANTNIIGRDFLND